MPFPQSYIAERWFKVAVGVLPPTEGNPNDQITTSVVVYLNRREIVRHNLYREALGAINTRPQSSAFGDDPADLEYI